MSIGTEGSGGDLQRWEQIEGGGGGLTEGKGSVVAGSGAGKMGWQMACIGPNNWSLYKNIKFI